MESHTKGLIKSMALPAFIFLGSTAYLGWFFDSEETKPARDFASEGLKAIAWHVTSPRCVVNDVCQYIDEDKSMGSLIAVKPTPSTLADSYTTLVTEGGDVIIEGRVTQLPLGETVQLYRKHQGQENALCVNGACFRVPYEPTRQGE